MKHPDLFVYRDLPGGIQAPSGPATEIPPKEAGTYRCYRLWRNTPEGRKAWKIIAHMALSQWMQHARRISINQLCETVRDQEHISINNTYRGWLSDSLIVEYPQLDELIRRRKRTKEKTL